MTQSRRVDSIFLLSIISLFGFFDWWGLARIRGAGILHFHDTANTAARFAVLVPPKPKRSTVAPPKPKAALEPPGAKAADGGEPYKEKK